MRAIAYERAGPARDVLRLFDLPPPQPKDGEVRIRVMASGVNPTDVKQRGGAPGRSLAYPLIIPHSDGAGMIDAVGAGVPASRIGERAWTFRGMADIQYGTAAEFTCVPQSLAIPLPENADFAFGAAIGIPALTAWHALAAAGDLTRKRVLVTGGAGNVGQLAIQMARHRGAYVVATVRGEARHEIALAAGANLVVDPRAEADARNCILEATRGEGIDLAVDVDTTGNAGLLAQVAAMDGSIASYGSSLNTGVLPIRDLRQKNITVRFLTIYRVGDERLGRMAMDVNGLIAANALKVRIAARYPLAECAAAHEAVEAGTAGKVLVEPQA